jgi:hypothetical protein
MQGVFMSVISKEIGKSGQSVIYKEITEITIGDVLSTKTEKILIEIKSDSYAFQSYARVSVWDNKKWNLIDHIHHSNMATETGLAYKPFKIGEEFFNVDRNKLVKIAQTLLA